MDEVFQDYYSDEDKEFHLGLSENERDFYPMLNQEGRELYRNNDNDFRNCLRGIGELIVENPGIRRRDLDDLQISRLAHVTKKTSGGLKKVKELLGIDHDEEIQRIEECELDIKEEGMFELFRKFGHQVKKWYLYKSGFGPVIRNRYGDNFDSVVNEAVGRYPKSFKTPPYELSGPPPQNLDTGYTRSNYRKGRSDGQAK